MTDLQIKETIQPTAVTFSENGVFTLMPFERDELFVGRQDPLERLHRRYSGPTPSKRMAVVGTTRHDKSSLAVEYAYQAREKQPRLSLFWVYGNDAASFEQSYRDIATTASIPAFEDPDADVSLLVMDWLNSQASGDSLLVVENVDSLNKMMPCLSKCLPNANTGMTLMTTGKSVTVHEFWDTGDLVNDPEDIGELEGLVEDDAVRLLTNQLPNDTSDESFKRAVRKLAPSRYNEPKSNMGWRYLKVIEMEERISGPDSKQALDSKVNMAAMIRHQGKYAEALDLQHEVLAKRTNILGAENPSTVSALVELGLMYLLMGQVGQSEQLIAETVQLHLKVLGIESPRAMRTMGHLATVYWEQGRRSEAVRFMQRVLELQKRVLDEDDPNMEVNAQLIEFWTEEINREEENR